MKSRGIICICSIYILLIFNASGQVILNPESYEPKNNIFICLGLEPEWVTSIGYRHAMAKRKDSFQPGVGASFKFAPLLLTQGAWRVNLTTTGVWDLNSTWKNNTNFDFYLVHSKSRAGRMNGIGFEIRSMPAYYGKKWVRALDLGWQCTFLTHVEHSQSSKDTFKDRYPNSNNGSGPTDGWYGLTAHRFRVGLSGARKIGDHFALQMSFGSLWNVQKQGIIVGFSHGEMPIYFDVLSKYSVGK